MQVFIQNNNKQRKRYSAPKTFQASVWGASDLLTSRIDLKDHPNIYNLDRYKILSINNKSVNIQGPPDKNFPNHHSSVLTLITNNSEKEVFGKRHE